MSEIPQEAVRIEFLRQRGGADFSGKHRHTGFPFQRHFANALIFPVQDPPLHAPCIDNLYLITVAAGQHDILRRALGAAEVPDE